MPLVITHWGGFRPSSNGGAKFVDEPLLRFLVDLEIQKAQRLRYYVSLVCFAAEIPPAGTLQPPGPSLEEVVMPCLRSTDAIAPWIPASLGLLLVDAEASHLPLILRRVTKRFDSVAWSAGGSCYPRTAASTADLFQQALDLMARAKEDGGNRLYVPS